jgi:undecaprenyl-diphosphatase
MDALLAWDRAATLWINQHQHPVLDAILMPPSLASEGGWGFILLVIGLLIFAPKRVKFLALIFMGGLLFTELALMPIFREVWPRPRPFIYMENINTIGHEWDFPSFPSAHAHLWLQATVLFAVVFRSWRWPMIVLAALACYSRPYAGMHHVLDVVAGMGLGTVIGFLDLFVANKLGLLPWRVTEEEEDTGEGEGVAEGAEAGE